MPGFPATKETLESLYRNLPLDEDALHSKRIVLKEFEVQFNFRLQKLTLGDASASEPFSRGALGKLSTEVPEASQ